MPSTDAAALRDFLHGLPQTDRYILLLFYADGLTVTEIGLVLDLPEPRVESRLRELKAQAAARQVGAVAAEPDTTANAATDAVATGR